MLFYIKKNFIFVFSLFLLFSCYSQNHLNRIVDFVKISETEINPTGGTIFFPYYYREKNDSLYVTFNNNQRKELLTYNLTTGKQTEKISISFFKYQNLKAFNYHSKDSIFLAFNAASISLDQLHDSSVMMVDNKGIIKNIYNFRGTPVITSDNIGKSLNSLAVAPYPFQNLYFNDNKLFLGIWKFLNYRPGDVEYHKVDLPLAGHIDVTKGNFYTYDKVKKFPYFGVGRYFPKNYWLMQLDLSDKNLPLMSFGHTPLIYEYNYISDTYVKHRIKSLLVDTITPGLECQKGCKDLHKALYGSFYFDRYRKLYYRFVTLPAKEDDTPYRKNNRKISMIVADTSFNVIAEGILPDNLSPLSLLITKEGLWFLNFTGMKKIKFELYKLNFKKGTKNDLLKEYNRKTESDLKIGVKQYLSQNFKHNKKNCAIVIIPSDLGCKSCASSIAKFYYDNQKLFAEKNIYFVIAGISEYTVNPFLAQNKITENMPHLFIDKKGEYLNYLEGFNNPRLYIIENNKIIHDKVYKPGVLFELEMKVKNYSEKK